MQTNSKKYPSLGNKKNTQKDGRVFAASAWVYITGENKGNRMLETQAATELLRVMEKHSLMFNVQIQNTNGSDNYQEFTEIASVSLFPNKPFSQTINLNENQGDSDDTGDIDKLFG